MQKNFTFHSSKIPSDELTTRNALFTNFKDLSMIKEKTGSKDKLYVKVKGKILEIQGANDIQDGCIAMGLLFRKMLGVGSTISDEVNFEYMYDRQPPKSNLTHVKFKVTLRDRREETLKLEDTQIIEIIRNKYVGSPINTNHVLFLILGDGRFSIEASELEIDPLGPLNENDGGKRYLVNFGFLANDTNIELSSDSSNLKITSKVMKAKALTKFGFNFNEMGVGGLDQEISNIFRRAFTTRLYPAAYLEKYGIHHVKGILLYGPPGTGKTLIARTLANALNVKEFKVVNGPELFDKYVGETEKKIRDLFANAEKDQKDNGDDAGLHVIVFDEIDSLCRARGTVSSGTGVHDSAVNQLLTKIDGVNSLNNIIVIGMTNRKDLIDEAILRPGRLELHIEIGLPDEKGRQQIFNIHTKKMRENKVLDDDVDLAKLAKMTKNYTGADIESMVKLACSNALSQGLSFGSSKINVNQEHKVNMKNFEDAFGEIQPMFGLNSTELENCIQFGMINYGTNYEILSSKISSLFEQIKNSNVISLLSVLLEGEPGCGKTALASYLALHSGFPYVKIISPESLVKYMENGKYNAIYNTFEDGYKSPYSIIILDNIEKLIEYIRIGPRFSNLLLQTLSVYIKKLPPKKGKKMLIIGTTSSSSQLEELGLVEAFDRRIQIPNLTKNEILNVLKNYECQSEEREKIANLVQNSPIKQLCFLIDRALQKNPVLMYENFASEYKEYVFK
ncbi:MAG: AAA family ATPase [Clostridia bacterium]|nr:AAA family ATPase [Clostridia bacterium]